MILFQFNAESDGLSWTLTESDNLSGAVVRQRRFTKGEAALSITNESVTIVTQNNDNIQVPISAILSPVNEGTAESAFLTIADIVN